MVDVAELVVRVPAHRQGDVFQLVGRLWEEEGRAGGRVAVEDPGRDATGSNPEGLTQRERLWTAGRIEELWRRCGDPSSRLFLRRMAECAPNGIDIEDLARELGYQKGAASVAGLSGAVGHASGGMKMPLLPWDWDYKMPKTIAAHVLRVAKA